MFWWRSSAKGATRAAGSPTFDLAAQPFASRQSWRLTTARMSPLESRLRDAPRLRYLLAAVLPLLAGAIAQALSVFGVTQLSFVFMTSVLFAGAFFGARPAMVAAGIAFAIYNFFLVEPRFSLQLASADDFITLVLFFVAAIVTGGLAGTHARPVASVGPAPTHHTSFV